MGDANGTLTASKPAWAVICLLMSIVLGLVSWTASNFRSDIREVQDKTAIHSHKLIEHDVLQQQISRRLERIEEKLDRMIQGRP